MEFFCLCLFHDFLNFVVFYVLVGAVIGDMLDLDCMGGLDTLRYLRDSGYSGDASPVFSRSQIPASPQPISTQPRTLNWVL